MNVTPTETVIPASDAVLARRPSGLLGKLALSAVLLMALGDGWRISLRQRDRDAVPLPPVHGFPACGIVPGIYGMKNVKWLTELKLVDHDYRGFWEQRGWSDEAIVTVQVFWTLTWHPPPAGRYTMAVRAMDKRGISQEAAAREVFPDGASGLHEVTVTVAA